MQLAKIEKMQKRSSTGFSLVEMLVYISVLVIVVGASIQILFLLDDRILMQQANQRLVRSSEATFEHILDSVRNADDIDATYSTFVVNPGVLVLTEGATTTEYERVNNQVQVSVNGVSQGSLTDENVVVNELRFFSYDNGTTKLVRAKLTLTAIAGEVSVTKTFNTSATLRGSYE